MAWVVVSSGGAAGMGVSPRCGAFAGVTFLSAYPRDSLRPPRSASTPCSPANAQVISRIVLVKSRAIVALCEPACVREEIAATARSLLANPVAASVRSPPGGIQPARTVGYRVLIYLSTARPCSAHSGQAQKSPPSPRQSRSFLASSTGAGSVHALVLQRSLVGGEHFSGFPLGELAFGSAQPRELRVQRRHGLGRSLGKWTAYGYDLWQRGGLRLQAGAAIAGLCLSAAGAQATQLLGGLIKEYVGVVGHGISSQDH